MSRTFQIQAITLIDDLKSVCANYGLGNDGNEYKIPAGTVLMSSRAPIGYTAIARNPVTTNQGFKSFVPSKGYSTEFIYYTLNHLMKTIEQNASGSTFKEVSAGTLKSIQTQLPAPAVLSEFSKLMQPIFSQQDNLEQQNQELTTLRDWLLPMLMNGQVRVAG